MEYLGAMSTWLALLLLSVLSVPSIDCDRILLMPFHTHSHVRSCENVGEALRQQGHDVYILMSPTYPGLQAVKDGPLEVITHHPADMDFLTASQDQMTEKFIEYFWKTPMMDVYRNMPPNIPSVAEAAAMDEELFAKLIDMKFDLVLVNNMPFSRSYLILAHKMRVPYAALEVQYEPWNMRSPSLPSFVPSSLLRHSDRMSFWERFDNFWRHLFWITCPGSEYNDNRLVRKLLPDEPDTSLATLYAEVKMWFIDTDFSIDYARPIMPNEILAGGLTTKPAKNLPAELEEFVVGAEHGVIVVSFGSGGADVPDAINVKFMEAFSRMKQRVVWRYMGTVSDEVHSNVKQVAWLPQNDLLGHNNTRLFVTHCGANGQFEALYHGVPMVNFPLFAEQHYNARRSASKGYSITLDIWNFNADELQRAMQEVLDDPTYQQRIQHGSAVFRDSLQTPLERITYSVNKLLRHGADHLHAHALDMPWYEYIMLDIFVFIVAVLSVPCILLLCVIKTILRRKYCEKHSKTD